MKQGVVKISASRKVLNKTKQPAIKKSSVGIEVDYKKIIDQFQDIYYRTDIDGTITLISPSVKTMAGYDSKELFGKNAVTLYKNPKDRDAFVSALKAAGKVENFEVFLKKKDGGVVIASINSHLIFDDKGKPLYIEGIIRDVTNVRQKTLEMERMNKLMVGREMKMIELKQEIERLKYKTKN